MYQTKLYTLYHALPYVLVNQCGGGYCQVEPDLTSPTSSNLKCSCTMTDFAVFFCNWL